MAPAAKQHARADQQDEEEAHGLLESRGSSASGEADGNASGSTSDIAQSAMASSSSSSKDKAAAQGSTGAAAEACKETGICRICLEEDLVSALEAPCACTGTQRHAHHACIQRWVDEKGNARCEICEQPYRGAYTVPPPPAAVPVDSLPLFTPMYILEASDPRHPYHHQRLDAMLEADQGLYQRNHSVSWCITFIIFFMFMVVLHHTLVVADGMDDGSTPASSPGMSPSGGAPSGGGGAAGGGGGMSPGGGPDDGNVATDLLLFLFWLATKAFLIGIPLLAVMRIASRQAQREHYEAMLQAASQYETNSRRMVIRVRANNTSSNAATSSASSSSAAAGGGSGSTPRGGTQVAPPPPLATAV